LAGAGAELFAAAIPVGDAAVRLAPTPQQALSWALYGGDDYELVFAVATEDADAAAKAIIAATGTPATVIGRLVERGRGPTLTLLWPDGRREDIPAAGYDHLRP